MKTVVVCFVSIALALPGATYARGTGTEIVVGADASIWDSSISLDPTSGIFPIGGAGQLNGEFTVARRDGIEIGLRISDRTDGLLQVEGTKKGIYHAATGYDTGTTDRAEWNYDWHVDLQEADDPYLTLADFDLTLTQTFAPKLNGSAGPLDLKFPDLLPGLLDNAVLYQSSQNAVFFNDSFDPNAEGTYNLMLKLAPKAGGAPLIVQVKVVVSDEI